MTPRDREALVRIIECVQAIDAYVERVRVDWPTDGMAVDAIAKRIEEIGEAAMRVAPEILVTMPRSVAPDMADSCLCYRYAITGREPTNWFHGVGRR